MNNKPANQFSRRTFVKGGSAFVAGASMLGFSGLFGLTHALAANDDIPTILNLATTAETLAVTHLHAALTVGKLSLTAQQVMIVKAALDSEIDHLDYLNQNGGKSLTDQFYTPLNVYTDLPTFVKVTEAAEEAFIGAYLAATRRFAELGNPLLAATASQIGGIEAQHLALVRLIGGVLPNAISLLEAPYFNVSDAVPTFKPFLEGADGFEKTPAKFPGTDAAHAAVGDVMVLKVPAIAEQYKSM